MSEEATLDDFADVEASPKDATKELFGLGELPADWEISPLSESAEIIPGNSPPSSTYNEDGEGLPFFQGNSNFGHFHPQADTWCSEPRKEAELNDILISIRAPVGDLNIADRNCCIGRGLAALRPKNLNGLYLYYNLAERKIWLSRLATGSTFKAISKSDLQLLDIPVPSLPEQRKIATVLYTVDRAIEKTEEIISQVEKLQMGIVQGLFGSTNSQKEADRTPSERSRIDSILDSRREIWAEAEKERQQRRDDFNGSIDESKYSQPLDVATQRLPELPDGWIWTSLDTFVAYDIDYRGKTPPYSDSGIPVISSGNIQNGEIVSKDEKHVSEETYDGWLDRGVPKEGDLLITTEAPVGKVTLYPDGTYLPTRRIITFRTVGVENRYLKAAIRHPYVQNYLTAQSGGSTVGRILKDHLLKTPIPLPPKEEQQQISDTLRNFDDRLANESEYKSRLQHLKRGLMQDLLSGTVRTTNTNIEVPDEIAQHG